MNPAELFRKESDTLQLAPGDFLFHEGDKGHKMYVLLEGEMEILLGDLVLETARPGALIGEMALIDESPRTASSWFNNSWSRAASIMNACSPRWERFLARNSSPWICAQRPMKMGRCRLDTGKRFRSPTSWRSCRSDCERN